MKVHFFQRYHGKENVATANTMLLLERLFDASPAKFYHLLQTRFLPDNSDVEMKIRLQEGNGVSIPDASIFQPSFRIVVETKLHGQFDVEQLRNHLNSFATETYKVLLTLDVDGLHDAIVGEIAALVESHNRRTAGNVIHRHMTFDDVIGFIDDLLDDRDTAMRDILDDFRGFCYDSRLITDAWQRMRMQLVGSTYEANRRLNLYYNDANRGSSDHAFIGLYVQKAVRAIGRISVIVVAGRKDGVVFFDKPEKGTLTDDIRSRIGLAIEDGYRYGYDMNVPNRYFIVERFVDTFFEKTTPNAPMGARVFDLTDVLGRKDLPGSIEETASLLRGKSWK